MRPVGAHTACAPRYRCTIRAATNFSIHTIGCII